eukprot:738199-Prorocentrum_minimum.AAC.1
MLLHQDAHGVWVVRAGTEPPLPSPSPPPLGNALKEPNTLSLQFGPCAIQDSGRCVASLNFPC